MDNFVNREEELRLIGNHLVALQQSNAALSAQIIEFHGVGGIGKTTLLKRVEQLCNDMHLPYIWTDANQSITSFSRNIIHQVQRYQIQLSQHSNDLFDQSIHATQALLARGPAIVIVDSLDAASEELLLWIENMLQRLIGYSRLLVVLASKRIASFKQTLSIARKLATYQLQTFNHKFCTSYINGSVQDIEPEICNIIFAWTNGYPLAVNVMCQAILHSQLDPRKEQDQKQLLSILTEQVINRGVLSTVVRTPIDLEWYQTMLGLFAVPRRFNIPIMQSLVEQFAPQYKLNSPLRYMTLPTRINQATDVLMWEPAKAGFSLETPIRHIFLMKLKIEQPAQYIALHRFLAKTTQQFAMEVSGTDRIRYWQEYLYHSANCVEEANLQQVVVETVQLIMAEPPEYFLQFHEEYIKDEELKTALGIHNTTVISLVYRHMAKINKQFAVEAIQEERIFHLRYFLYYCILDPMITDLSSHLQPHIQQVVQEEPREVRIMLYEQLSEDIQIKKRLGEHITILSYLIHS
jgi:hypothetical protein